MERQKIRFSNRKNLHKKKAKSQTAENLQQIVQKYNSKVKEFKDHRKITNQISRKRPSHSDANSRLNIRMITPTTDNFSSLLTQNLSGRSGLGSTQIIDTLESVHSQAFQTFGQTEYLNQRFSLQENQRTQRQKPNKFSESSKLKQIRILKKQLKKKQSQYDQFKELISSEKQGQLLSFHKKIKELNKKNEDLEDRISGMKEQTIRECEIGLQTQIGKIKEIHKQEIQLLKKRCKNQQKLVVQQLQEKLKYKYKQKVHDLKVLYQTNTLQTSRKTFRQELSGIQNLQICKKKQEKNIELKLKNKYEKKIKSLKLKNKELKKQIEAALDQNFDPSTSRRHSKTSSEDFLGLCPRCSAYVEVENQIDEKLLRLKRILNQYYTQYINQKIK